MRASLSSIVALAEANSSANSAQLAFDSGVEAFSAEATNFVNCAAMGVGSLAFSTVRLGASAALSSQLIPGKAALTWMAGVFGEVAAFRSVSQLAENHLHQQSSALAAQGFFQTMLDISLIKIAGHAVRSDHFFVRHSTSALGMVAGGYASQALDLSPESEQNFAQRFSHAFAASLAMETGACLSRMSTGSGLNLFQRKVDQASQVYESARTSKLAAQNSMSHARFAAEQAQRLPWPSYEGWMPGRPLPRIVVMVGAEKHAAHCLEAILKAKELGRAAGFPIGEIRILSNARPSERVQALLERYGVSDSYRWKSAGELGVQRQAHFDWMAREWDDFSPNVILMAKYMYVLPEHLVAQREMRILNLHHGKLPGLKGRVPVATAFQAGTSLAAVSFHFAVAGLDEGALIHQVSFPIDKSAEIYVQGSVEEGVYRMMLPIVQEAEICCLLNGLHLVLNGKLALVRNQGLGFAEGKIAPELMQAARVVHTSEPDVDFGRLGYTFPEMRAAYERGLRQNGLSRILRSHGAALVEEDWDALGTEGVGSPREALSPQPDGGEEAMQPVEEAPHVPSVSAEPVRVEATDTEVLVGSSVDAEPTIEHDLVM